MEGVLFFNINNNAGYLTAEEMTVALYCFGGLHIYVCNSKPNVLFYSITMRK